MPLFEFECDDCGVVFEALAASDGPPEPCRHCGSKRTTRLLGAPAVRVQSDQATGRIEKRVRSYLMDGKFADARRFADKAASMVKSDKVKKIADKLHQKTGK